jgi:hypothetical protein
MIIADRNRCLADLINDPLFESELKSFRLSLIEQRKHLLLAYGSATSDDIRKIILVLLNSADNFLELLSIENSSLWKPPCDTVKDEMGITAGISLISSEKNSRRYGIHGTYVVEQDFGRESTKEVIKSDPGIYVSTIGGK